VGLFGLNTWRKRLRGGRQVAHAEQALAAGEAMFIAIRDMRSFLRMNARPDLKEPIARAVEEWQRFQTLYALVRVFTPSAELGLDVAKHVSVCLQWLRNSAKSILENDPDSEEAEKGPVLFLRDREAVGRSGNGDAGGAPPDPAGRAPTKAFALTWSAPAQISAPGS
jgi:hypothetical protein